MSPIAIDVVLLPDTAMTDKAIALNRMLVGDDTREIVLGRETRLPHISLAMGCIDESDIDAIAGLLRNLARKEPVGRLRITGIVTSTNARGQKTSLLEVERTPALQALHESVMEELSPFFRHEASAAAVCDDVVAETTLEWIRRYREKAAFERFLPHITIGYGQMPDEPPFPIDFNVAELALCHLGNHCTCRRVLTSVPLR